MKPLKQEAISIVKKFGGSLKPELKKALKSGGPVNAIDICSVKAPQIAANLSKKTGWDIRRVSLKARSESAEKMAFAEKVNGQFRFMKAQGVGKVCLNCHGAKVSADVETKLKALYPNDKARGYSLGQIRDAFSLSKKLP